tara:strand:+ start:38869 stop:39783 length:915 start_codon:yes stop_codon:yes gene_type:complete
MLIIGDVATRKFNPNHKIRSVEIVYHDFEELEFILIKYDLKIMKHNSLHHQIYMKDGVEFRLYDKKQDKVFIRFMNQNMDRKMRVTYCNPFYNFVLDTTRVVNFHGKFKDWVARVESYNFLSEHYVQDLVNYNEKYNGWISKLHNMLNSFVINQRQVATRPYCYHKCDIEREELLQVVCTTYLNFSSLYRIWEIFDKDNKYKRSERRFYVLSYQEQITACVDSLYIDVITECIIPYIKDTRMQPEDEVVDKAFLKCIMYRASQTTDKWFGQFMIDNYKEIVDCYDISFYNCFRNTLRIGEINIT